MVDLQIEGGFTDGSPYREERSYGRLSPAQRLALQPFVRGRRFRDYGCGNMYIASIVLGLGARHVEAIDLDRHTPPPSLEGPS